MSVDFPITPAVRFLRSKDVSFVPHLYEYVEKGGTRESAKQRSVDEHAVVKTLVFETDAKKPLIVLMHGDREVSTKNGLQETMSRRWKTGDRRQETWSAPESVPPVIAGGFLAADERGLRGSERRI